MKKVYRQGPVGIILLGAIEVFIIVAGTISFLHDPSQIYAILFLLLLFGGFLLNYIKTKIVVDDFSLAYEILFKTKSIAFAEITKIETCAKLESRHPGQVGGKIELSLYSFNQEIHIRIKPYSKKNLMELSQLLLTKCLTAEIDKRTRLMAEGKMPYIFVRPY